MWSLESAASDEEDAAADKEPMKNVAQLKFEYF